MRSMIAFDSAILAVLMMHRKLPGLYQSELSGIDARIKQQRSQRELEDAEAAKFSRVSRQQRRAAERRAAKGEK